MSDPNLPATPPSDADLVIPLAERKTVETLSASDCRWPFGDPQQEGFHFCGKPHADGSPYCEFHKRRAFQTARPRAAVYRPHAA